MQAATLGALFVEGTVTTHSTLTLWSGKKHRTGERWHEHWRIDGTGWCEGTDKFVVSGEIETYCAVHLASHVELVVGIKYRKDGGTPGPYGILDYTLLKEGDVANLGFVNVITPGGDKVFVEPGKTYFGTEFDSKYGVDSKDYLPPNKSDRDLSALYPKVTKDYTVGNDHCGPGTPVTFGPYTFPIPRNFAWSVFKAYHPEFFKDNPHRKRPDGDHGAITLDSDAKDALRSVSLEASDVETKGSATSVDRLGVVIDSMQPVGGRESEGGNPPIRPPVMDGVPTNEG